MLAAVILIICLLYVAHILASFVQNQCDYISDIIENHKNYARKCKLYAPSNKRKGEIGEMLVREELRKLHRFHKVINDFDVELKDGTKFQIDHILITKSGIYVLETKYFYNTLHGRVDDIYWYQTLNGKYTNTFYNPILQNKGHVDKLSKVIKDQPLKSLVVFARGSIEKVKYDGVIKIDELNKTIRKDKDKILSRSDIRYYYKQLLKFKETHKREEIDYSDIQYLKKELPNN